MDLLEPSEYVTRCPYKGAARHWSARVGDKLVEDSVELSVQFQSARRLKTS